MSLLAQDQRLTRRVGAVTIALLLLATIFFVVVAPQIDWGSHIRIRVYFASTGGLAEGAPFVVAGREIGKIESLVLSPRGAPGPLGGEEGIVAIVALDKHEARRVTKGGDVFVTSHGVLSTRFLELGPPPTPGGPTFSNGDEVRGQDPPALDRVFQRTLDNLNITKRFADEVRPEAHALMEQIDQLQATMLGIAPEILFRDDFQQLFDEAKKTYAVLGGAPGVLRMEAVKSEADSTLAQARQSLAKLRVSADMLGTGLAVLKQRLGGKGAQAIDHVEAAIDRVKLAIDKMDPLLAQVDDIQQRIARGDGSLLKLMRDPEFPEDAKELGKILKRQPWKLLDRPPK